MFINLGDSFSSELQSAVLVINTVILIIMLITAEIVFSDAPKEQRKNLRLLYPFIALCVCLVLFAAYLKLGGHPS